MEYPWFELVEDSDIITQGDILMGCQVPVIKDLPESMEGALIDAEIITVDGIILTQACDIENGKVENIIICSITAKDDFEKQLTDQNQGKRAIKKNIEGIIKWQQNAFHIINNYQAKELVFSL